MREDVHSDPVRVAGNHRGMALVRAASPEGFEKMSTPTPGVRAREDSRLPRNSSGALIKESSLSNWAKGWGATRMDDAQRQNTLRLQDADPLHLQSIVQWVAFSPSVTAYGIADALLRHSINRAIFFLFRWPMKFDHPICTI